MSKETGGPAFPIKDYKWLYEDEYEGWDGMTLRDYFAAKAMQGYLSATTMPSHETIAIWSYKMADSMLKERSK